MSLASHIAQFKTQTGPNAYLWAHSSGDVILWESEDDSVDSDGRNALGRWRLERPDVDSLIASGVVDDVA